MTPLQSALDESVREGADYVPTEEVTSDDEPPALMPVDEDAARILQGRASGAGASSGSGSGMDMQRTRGSSTTWPRRGGDDYYEPSPAGPRVKCHCTQCRREWVEGEDDPWEGICVMCGKKVTPGPRRGLSLVGKGSEFEASPTPRPSPSESPANLDEMD